MPLTADRPKPLIEVAGVTLLDHVLDHLRAAGIRNVVINAHYRADQIEQHMAKAATDLNVAISDERNLLLDTGGGLIRALPLIHSDPFLCINADNWWSNEGKNALVRLEEHWDETSMDVLMLLIPFAQANNTQGQGDFDVDRTGRLSRRLPGATGAFVWTGIQLLSRRLIVDPPSDMFSTNIFWDRAIEKGRCFGMVHDGLWFDVGYPAAIAATEQKLMQHAGG
jgi:N-acetyl-alpha-D-muramate 1-phosphate uridylyltransferase